MSLLKKEDGPVADVNAVDEEKKIDGSQVSSRDSSSSNNATARATAAVGVPPPTTTTTNTKMKQPDNAETSTDIVQLVEWNGPDDPDNPLNFPRSRKWIMTLVFALLTMWATFSTSIFSSATEVTAKEFHVSTEVMVLGTSLNVLGFAFGPLIWGPLSELYGRLRPLYFGYIIFIIFQIPVAVAQNLETIMLCRFISGFFGCSSTAIVGGALADFWGPVDRAVAIAFFSAAIFVGPIFGPIIGGFIVDSYLGWRWTAWITLIAAAFFGSITVWVMPETYHAVILQRRAARLRKATNSWGYHAALDKSAPTFHDILVKYLFRPFQMLFREPILVAITLYISLIYGILYLFFEAYPISFHEHRGWKSLGISALPFLGILFGVLIGCVIVAIMTKKYYAQKLIRTGNVVPEDRLPPMMIGAVLLPLGLFWFAWTSNPHIFWLPQVLAGVPIGAGIIMIWMQGLNYLIDVYLFFANSAISGNTLIRSMVGASFPLFATAMYDKLGVNWASTLLAFLTLAMVPIPIVFYIYGAKIRAMSKFKPVL